MRWLLVALLAVAATAGLVRYFGSSTPLRAAVEGTVTLDGEPLDHAVIMFVSTSPNNPTKTGSEIIAGRYSIALEDGPAIGPNRVEISTYVGPDFSKPAQSHGKRKAIVVKQVPASYSTASKLTADISADVSNICNYDLKTSEP